MAADIVPELYESIMEDFREGVEESMRIERVMNRIRDGTASLVDAHDYAEELGDILSRALRAHLTAETLPNQTLYYNIAYRTVIPALRQNHDMVTAMAGAIQKMIDEANGVGLSFIKPDFPEARVVDLVKKMTEPDRTLDEALVWIGEPIVNNSEAFMDDFVRSNARFKYESGMEAIITREARWNCCEWCQRLSGSYDYANAPDDVYRRHENCRCVVTYHSEKKRQNVWTKEIWESSPEELERRKKIVFTPRRASVG